MFAILMIIATLDACLLFWRIIGKFARDNADLTEWAHELEGDNKRLATYCLELQARCKRLERLAITTRPEVEIGRIERGNWVWTIEINLN